MHKTVVCNLAVAGLLARAMAATIIVGSAGIVGPAGPDCVNASVPNIDAALVLARAGDEVRVCPGVYYAPAGGWLLDKAGLRVIASGPGDAVKLVARNPGVRGARGYGFVVLAEHVRIEGFEISGFRDTGSGAGILVGGDAYAAEIERNHIHDNSVGIRLSGGRGHHQIRHNVIHHSPVDGAGSGAGIVGSGGTEGNVIFHNILHHNEAGAIRLAGGSAGTRIINNRVTDNGPAGAGDSQGMGFHLESDYGVTVQGNVCKRNGLRQQDGGGVRTAER